MVASGRRVIPLDPGSVAQLAVAGRVSCDPGPAVRDSFDVLVENRTVTVALPDIDDWPWSSAMAAQFCP